jgi:hypothetical protein
MRKCLYLTILITSLFTSPGFSQKENYFWAMGIHSYLDFNIGPLSIGYLPNIVGEGDVGVCNRHTGALQFYSNGIYVWDKNNNLMPNGSGLMGGAATSSGPAGTTVQGAVAVPFISDTSKYYIFCLQGQAPSPPYNNGALYYSVVDMALNAGLGDVVAAGKNTFLHDTLSEGMVAAKSDHCTIWVIVHSMRSNTFYAYEVTATGINPVPVVSFLPDIVYYPGVVNKYIYSEIKMSPDFTKMAVMSDSYGYLCDFDRGTGVVSNMNIYDSTSAMSSSCFSHDGKKLYDVHGAPSGGQGLYQFDLNPIPPATVFSTKTFIVDYGSMLDIQRSPLDSTLYISNQNGYMSRIMALLQPAWPAI